MKRALWFTVLACQFFCAAASAADSGPPVTVLEVTAGVPVDQDGCLDHTVRELGMSAKKVEGARRWTMGPQFLHPSIVKGGTFGVGFDKGEQATVVRVTATWPGDRKAKEVQSELEARLAAMAGKLAQLCGVIKAPLTCLLTEPARKPVACSPVP